MCENRQTPDLGPLAVTGATGGVGSLAVDIFSKAGSRCMPSAANRNAGYLTAIGARKVLPRDALATTRPMETARFGGGLDNVGGPMLASLLAQTVPYGNVATAGLAASADLATTVMPFIIRGVSLLGVAFEPAPPATSATRCGNGWPATGSPRTWTPSAPGKPRWRACRRCSGPCWPAAPSVARSCEWDERQSRHDGRHRLTAFAICLVPNTFYNRRRGQLGNSMAKILIVDDSPSQLLGIQRIVEKLGHESITAEDGAAGVEVAKRELPDMVLMDVVMPNLNGFQATRTLSREATTKYPGDPGDHQGPGHRSHR